MKEAETDYTGIDTSATSVTPTVMGNEGGNGKGRDDDEDEVILVLPLDDSVLVQVSDVGDTRLATGLDEHPANMRIEKATVSIVRVKVSVGVAMMGTVTTRPPLDGAFDSTSTSEGEKVLQRLGGVVGSVCPKSMISCSDAESSDVVVEDAPDSGLPAQRSRIRANDTHDWGREQNDRRNPVYVTEQVAERDWR